VALQNGHKREYLGCHALLADARTTLRSLARSALLLILISAPAASEAQGPESSAPSKTSHAGSALTSAASGAAAPSVSSAGLTDEPIFAGEIVQVSVFNAPDFSTVMRVSQSGDIGVPYLGVVHVAGLSSVSAADLITGELKRRNLVLDPHLLVTVDATTTGITVLGEVRIPGIYPPTGKHMLSDVLAAAGGVTANIGRVIEISSEASPEQKTFVPWDPTMHNTSSYDRLIYPGQRVLVRPCGFVYVGGSLTKPGAYATCGSPAMTLSQLISLAGGIAGSAYMSHTIIVRPNPDGTKTVYQIDLDKVLHAERADPVLHDEDIVFVPASYMKATLKKIPDYAFAFGTALLYVYR
jgi:polysaccharide export outer membrane protein